MKSFSFIFAVLAVFFFVSCDDNGFKENIYDYDGIELSDADDISDTIGDTGSTDTGDTVPGDSGDTVPGDSGDTVPGDSGDTVPGDSGDTVPGDSGDTVPGDSGDTVPGDSGDTVPGDSGDTVPGDSGDTVPGDSGDTVPGDSGDTVPGDSGDTVPGDSGDTVPGDSGDTVPGDSGDTVPGDSGDTVPGDSGDTVPGDSGDTVPGDSGDTVPGDSGDTVPGDSGDTVPGDSGDTEPGDTGDTEPIECTGISIGEIVEGDYINVIISDEISGLLDDNIGELEILFSDTGDVVGEYNLGEGVNTNYKTCKQCVVLSEGDSNGYLMRRYFQEEGTLTITEMNEIGQTNGSVSAKLVESTFASDGTSTPTPNGACVEFEAASWEHSTEIDFSNSAPECASIYTCRAGCFTQYPDSNSQDFADCWRLCYLHGTPAGKITYNNMNSCWINNCSDVTDSFEYSVCIYNNCRNETKGCNFDIPAEPNTAYHAPYGHVSINVDSHYLLPEDDLRPETLSSGQFVSGYFVSGTFGNSNSNIIPSGTSESRSYYIVGQDVREGNKLIEVSQAFMNTSYLSTTPKSFVVEIYFDRTLTPGTHRVGLRDGDMVVAVHEYNWTDKKITCDHAFGFGELTISEYTNTVGENGVLKISGEVDLYNGENVPIYGGNIKDFIINYSGTCSVRD